ncbi:Dal82p KNAG_0K02500 [Huiozyma naganishii CBS 8797]|uniref:Uncharacterized protein n=1 Tax=Huiozyma naganishii (strain ATCC MYA-139 / BCRC 22969 / CBS 8797 / KCTC 17520 / NBRC 10181 / NCYC 3082 / Yp74L-3) TaxID=1071383 RepID=J7RRV8_HUIN7|nr:hypothetical protein KNAG_0K02500 [Kazachstania naganishii CBS 8797]CCK72613.1 hypothetical protein KNAG_0K02500 [Kazachstania naganishii CBS 8797]
MGENEHDERPTKQVLRRSRESLDLLLTLLNTHKPHLKPYSCRLSSWYALLMDYNTAAGTTLRQPRTLRTRFERIMGLFRTDRALVNCSDPGLLARLVEEYSKPYRLMRKSSPIEPGAAGAMPKSKYKIVKQRPLHQNNNAVGVPQIKVYSSREDFTNDTPSSSSISPHIKPLDTIQLGMPNGGHPSSGRAERDPGQTQLPGSDPSPGPNPVRRPQPPTHPINHETFMYMRAENTPADDDPEGEDEEDGDVGDQPIAIDIMGTMNETYMGLEDVRSQFLDLRAHLQQQTNAVQHIRDDVRDLEQNSVEGRTSIVEDIELTRVSLVDEIQSVRSAVADLRAQFEEHRAATRIAESATLKRLDRIHDLLVEHQGTAPPGPSSRRPSPGHRAADPS